MDSFFIKYNQSYLKVEFGHCADCVHFAWMTNGLDIKNILIAIFNIGFWWPSSPFLERPWAVYQTFFDLLKFFSNPLLLSHSRGAPPMVVNLYPIRWANPSAPQYKSIIMYSINWVMSVPQSCSKSMIQISLITSSCICSIGNLLDNPVGKIYKWHIQFHTYL